MRKYRFSLMTAMALAVSAAGCGEAPPAASTELAVPDAEVTTESEVDAASITATEADAAEPVASEETAAAPEAAAPEAAAPEAAAAETTAAAEDAAPATAEAAAPAAENTAQESAPVQVAVAEPESQPAGDSETATAGDWPMWGGDPTRNMVNQTTGVSLNFVGDDFANAVLKLLTDGSAVKFEDAVEKLSTSALSLESAAKDLASRGLVSFTVERNKESGERTYSDLQITEQGSDAARRIVWTAPLGSQTYGNPVVAEGRVLVGTNNGGEYRENHKGDRGVVLCFDEKSGEFLWQLTREKLESGRVNDWPEQGICSTPCVEDGRVYVVSNRCEVMCLDLAGFHDGENDGDVTDEVDSEKLDADIIWSLDMMDELGVFPHNLATSSPVIHGDLLLLVTSNGVDEAHLEVPSPRGPSFLAMNKNTGEVVWEDGTPSLESPAPEPFNNILHGQWSSPAIGEIDGKAQVFMPGGDGVLYSFDVESGEMLWWFDLNPKDSGWELGGRGTRNNIISTPVFLDNSVILSVGQDPEHGAGIGHIYRIDATKSGDISPQVADDNGGWKENPNSGQIWHFGGLDTDGSITGETNGVVYGRTISTVAINNGLVYAPDLSGFLHCLDFESGQQKWVFDTYAEVWGSPMVLDGHVMLGDQDGELVVLKDGAELEELDTKKFTSSIYSTPTIANGRMFVSDRSRLYVIDIK